MKAQRQKEKKEPIASSPEVTMRMKSQAQKNTTPEIMLKRLLYREGLRYRINCRPVLSINTRADLVFRRAKVAVFIDGCFWHACPWHGTFPKSNAAWWKAKLKRNRARDLKNKRLLKNSGWKVIRIWSHSNFESNAKKIVSCVNELMK